jgi:2-methylcitrate dehydratase PrpD
MSLTASLAEFIVNTGYEDLHKEVVQAEKNSFLDTLGIALGGSVEEGPKIVSNFVSQMGGEPVSSIIGHGVKNSPQNAALVNGTSGDILGMSDTGTTMNHPSVAVLPAVWALAELTGASGKDIILAHILGVEVSSKIGRALMPDFDIKGWHPCSVFGTFGAAAAAGKILQLDVTKMANALGLAGVETSGVKGGMGTMAKSFSRGRAAADGVIAAMLAGMGFTGPTNILEGRDGFLQTFGNGASGDGIIASLGNPYEFVSPGLTLKPYPSCTCSHSSIDIMLKLKREHGFTPDDVESVEFFVSPQTANYLKFPDPKTPLEAKYSLQFCCAAALIDGDVGIDTFSWEKMADPNIVRLMTRIKMSVSRELAQLGYRPTSAPHGSKAMVRLRNGTELSHRQDTDTWGPENPPSWDSLLSKYRKCAQRVLSLNQIDESANIIACLEDVKDIHHLMDVVRA